MTDPARPDPAFEAMSAEQRVARTARMLDEATLLDENQRADIIERFERFTELYGLTRRSVARELGVSETTLSEVTRLRYRGQSGDRQLVKLNNWMELAARRDNLIRRKRFVETSVARDILYVADIVAETCKMGVVFGPSHIGKTMTLEAIAGDPRYGDPVLIRIDETLLRPFALCRAIASTFKLSPRGTFDEVLRRIIQRLTGTKRMLCFDEVERCSYRALELVRDLHDHTGCPVLLCGKPMVYERLGCRHVGDFAEITDQLAARIVIRRDLTERTRSGPSNDPLFTLDDIRKLIHGADLKLVVEPDAVRWLQSRASALGTGGLGRAMVCLFLACKLAFVKGDGSIRAEHLDAVEDMAMGHEDAERMAEVAASSSGMRNVI